MKNHLLHGLFLHIVIFILITGCMVPPIKDPTVSVSDIALSDVSLQTMKVNATVIICNPNPIRAKLNKVAFDVYFLDDTREYLGHGEQSDIEVMNNVNPTVTLPVKIGNIHPAREISRNLMRPSGYLHSGKT